MSGRDSESHHTIEMNERPLINQDRHRGSQLLIPMDGKRNSNIELSTFGKKLTDSNQHVHFADNEDPIKMDSALKIGSINSSATK